MPSAAPDQSALLPPAFKKILSRAVALPLALAILVAAVFGWQVTKLLAVNAALERSDHVMDCANRLQMYCVDRETGLRAYVITGKESFLEPFDKATRPLSESLTELRALVKNKPDLSDIVDRIVEKSQLWLEYADSLKAKVGQGGDEAKSVVSTAEERS